MEFRQILKVMLSLVILAVTAPAWSKPACVVRDIIESHRTESGKRDFIDLGEGRGVYPNPFSPTPKRQTDYSGPDIRTDGEIKNLFESVRAITIEEIAGGKPESQWTDRQKLMVTRIRNLGVKVDNCSGTAENISVGQILQFCNMSRNLPLPALVGVMAHEIGHSVDLCSLSRPYFKMDFSAPLDRDLPAGSTAAEQADISDLNTTLDRAKALGADFMIQKAGTSEIVQKIYSRWQSRGLMTRIDAGIDDALNPARATFACLRNQNTHFASEKLMSEAGRCQASETGAQVWAARSLANYLKKHPESSRDMYASMVSLADFSLSKGASVGGKELDFQSIYLSEPEMQKALGCEPLEAQNCMSYFDPTAGAVGGNLRITPVKGGAKPTTAQ